MLNVQEIVNCKLKIINSRVSRGYTLLEILVGLIIIGLLFSIGYASFRSFSQRQGLQSVARGIKGDLRLAQELALAGKKPSNDPAYKCGCTASNPSCSRPSNYLNGFSFNVSATSYTIKAECSGGNVSTKTVNIPSGITLSITSNPIIFKILGQGNNITGSVTITITQTGMTPVTVTVTQGGEIK